MSYRDVGSRVCYNSSHPEWTSTTSTTFLEIAKQGSFSRAGQKLFRSQPAVSAQIRQLEEEYGQKLFDRVGKSMKLTAAGEVLLGYAGRLITLKNDSLRAVADQSSAPRGTLAVGANEATCLYVLPDVFRRVPPSVSLRADQRLSQLQPQGNRES